MRTDRVSATELLEVCDEEDRVMALLSRDEIHRQRLMHRAVHIFLFDPKGRIYLQKRAQDKDEHPGLWDSSAAGHVEPGEPYMVAAKRELLEELGLNCSLDLVLKLPACEETGWEHVCLYRGETRKPPRPNPRELEDGRFFTVEEVRTLLEKEPENFTPCFRLLWSLYEETTK